MLPLSTRLEGNDKFIYQAIMGGHTYGTRTHYCALVVMVMLIFIMTTMIIITVMAKKRVLVMIMWKPGGMRDQRPPENLRISA